MRNAEDVGHNITMDFIVLSSSRGTTFQAVIDAMKNGSLMARCLGLVADRSDRGCLDKARKADLPVKIVERVKGEERESYDRRLNEAIGALMEEADDRLQKAESQQPQANGHKPILACIGWMFMFSPWFVVEWKNRILNVHPALLPRHPGGHAVDDALNAGDTETGMTVHWINEGLDTGEIIVQKKCSIKTDDTVETLKARIQELEKEWYPRVLQDLETGKLRMENGE